MPLVLSQLHSVLHKLISILSLSDDTRNHFHFHSERFSAGYVIIDQSGRRDFYLYHQIINVIVIVTTIIHRDSQRAM